MRGLRKYGEIANSQHTSCHQCPDRETYIPGDTNGTGKCGCGTQGGEGNNGYYDASETLIVCFHDGYQIGDVEDVYKALTKSFASSGSSEHNFIRCQECPACVDCRNGYPMLRNGYTVGEVLTIDAQGRRVGVPENEVQPELMFPDQPQLPGPDDLPKHWRVHNAFFCDVSVKFVVPHSSTAL